MNNEQLYRRIDEMRESLKNISDCETTGCVENDILYMRGIARLAISIDDRMAEIGRDTSIKQK